MKIPDLEQFSPGSPPSPYGMPLSLSRDQEWGEGLLDDDVTLQAVGWLGDLADPVGDVSDSCIDKLFSAYERNLIFSDGTMGWHDCEMCSGEAQHYPRGDVGPIVEWKGRELRLYGHGHYLIKYRKIVYMAPALLLHYILDHQYMPPDQFISAVTEGRFLTEEDLMFRRIKT